jgi:hypothetical protein
MKRDKIYEIATYILMSFVGFILFLYAYFGYKIIASDEGIKPIVAEIWCGTPECLDD